ncbi:protein cereblon isoform X1 [Nasonia vitripennis]|uniref:Protein cereblon n=1 Tax=Nasonia vitripennis TaxID=7425 RepID=A0A7M7G4N7_NASVI|nr:protein cereblon isoform X1 [Nasonia vitripennis]
MEDQVATMNETDAESTGSNEPNESDTVAENDVNSNESANLIENVNMNENNETSSASDTHDFDLNLPASHSYLGSNLEELRGRTLLDEGIYINLPLLIKQSVILFPGQTLPMTVFGSNIIGMLEKCIQKNRTFGVVCQQIDKEPIGTTAEIYEYSQGNPEEGFRIKAKGRQRFKILRMMQGYSEISANVKIMPEITLTHPFIEQRLASLDHQRIRPVNEEEQKKQEKLERLEAMLTPWPAWIYRQYDPYTLAFKIRQQLQFIETRGSCIPTDPTELSFWVAQNLPLNDSERMVLLRYDCAIPRLQWELKYLTKDRILVCSNCEKHIGNQSDLFPMSKEGPQSTFCNSGGFIHDTVTLYQAKNLTLNAEPPSAEYSWFPGYAWTIATCKGCGIHMGWQFTADKDKTLRPSAFWGLTRRGLKSKLLSGYAELINYSSDENNQNSD